MQIEPTYPPLLSILIPSVPERSELYYKLYDNVMNQYNKFWNHLEVAEVISDLSEGFLNGGKSIGQKRNDLLKQATGKYVCFLDDDETIAPNYIETLLNLCKEDKDVCTFRALYKLNDYWGLVKMSIKHHVNEQATPEYTIRRKPFHICPVRTEYAQMYEFEDKNNAEDFEWMEKVLTHCTTEAHTDRIIFQYNHGKHSEADKITNSEAI